MQCVRVGNAQLRSKPSPDTAWPLLAGGPRTREIAAGDREQHDWARFGKERRQWDMQFEDPEEPDDVYRLGLSIEGVLAGRPE
jgi:hypothetical protein